MTDRVVKFPGSRRAAKSQPSGDGSPAPDSSCAGADNSNGRAKPYAVLANYQFECLTAAIRAIAPKDRPAAQRRWRKSLPPSPRNACLRAVHCELIDCVFYKFGYAEVRLETIAKAVGYSKRQVRRAVRALVELGVVGVLHRHGQDGHKIASRYVPLDAQAVKMGEVIKDPTRGSQGPVGEVINDPTREDIPDLSSTFVSSDEHISHGQPQLPSARSGRRPQGRWKHQGRFKLRAGEAQFDAWIAEMRKSGRHDMADAAQAKGEIDAPSRWPETALDAWPIIEDWEPTPYPAGPDQ